MSDFAFKVSSKDRKIAMGEKVSPSDVDYDPESRKYPDPLKEIDAFSQQYLQEYNSLKRRDDLDQDEVDYMHDCFCDFLDTCFDENLGPDDLPGARTIVELFSTNDGKNGISTFGGVEKEAVIPVVAPLAVSALAAAGRMAIPKLLPYVGRAASALLPSVGGKLKNAIKKAPGTALKGLATGAGLSLLNGGGGGGQDGPGIQTSLTLNQGPGYQQGTRAATNRFEMPVSHIEDNLMFDKSSARPPKRDDDIETLRAQVNAALTQWSKSGEVENRAEWWVYYSYSHEAETISELQTILTAIPSKFHESVLTSPTDLSPEEGDVGQTGLPELANPESITSPSATNMSPVPIDGVGTPPKMPSGPAQQLIPGAMASHDKLKARPVFGPIDESAFDEYVEKDRQILARVSAFMQQGVHEEEIVETLHPSYGHEYTIWAVEQVKKVALNNPHDLPEGMHQMDILEMLEEIQEEQEEDKKKENNKFPSKGEYVGQNEDQKINQQETSGMITPENEKVADYTAMPPNTLMATTPPYSANYNQTMGLMQQTQGDPWQGQMQLGLANQNNMENLPPNPQTLNYVKDKQQEDEQLQKLYPNVSPDIARQWLQSQNQQQAEGHPNQNTQALTGVSPSGQKASPSSQQLPSATTSKVAAWKDVKGNLLQENKLYKMTSSDYGVPDYVRIVDNGSSLKIHIANGNLDVLLTEKEIKEANYRFEPINEQEQKTAFLLSESALNTFEQRELIDEQGVARNLDRLNLEGTHYINFSSANKDDIIQTEDDYNFLQNFFVEDLDLFI